MTWVKLDDNALDDPRLLNLARGEVLMALEGLAYSNRYLLDGRLPREALRKITTEPDLEAAAAHLVAAGIWKATDEGWQILWLLDDQPKATVVEEERKAARGRSQRHRERERKHRNGDHTLCDSAKCWVLRAGERSGERTNERSAPHPVPPRPARDEKDKETGDPGAASAAIAAPGGGNGAASPVSWLPPVDDGDDAWWASLDAGFRDCSRCGVWLPRTALKEETSDSEGEVFWCPSCSMGRWGDDCMAFKKDGTQCGNDRAPDGLWCRYHRKESQRGAPGADERAVIERAALAALATVSGPRLVVRAGAP